MQRIFLLLVCACSGLVGCGQSGPLFLPPPPPAKKMAAPAPPTVTSTSVSSTTTTRNGY